MKTSDMQQDAAVQKYGVPLSQVYQYALFKSDYCEMQEIQ
jgi:hypothetical protein